jgi:glycosyltransferase involved in cell wall biosynthesis
VLRHGGYDLLDVQGLDLLFASLILTGKQRFKILYEIADLHYLLIEKRSWVENIVGHFLRLIEKKMIKRVTALLLTSKRYYDIYYANLIDIKRVVFFPNIPDVSVFDGYSPKRGGVFTVGYIGSVRFERQLIMLVDVCEKLRIDVMIAGIDHAGIITKYCEGKQFVKNLGKFNYNEQIADIYGMCDCVYSVYDSSVKNVRVALPNKLYEAVKCSLPIIVSKGTYLSEVVDNWGVGCAVDCDSAEDLEAVLSKIMSKGTVYKNYVMKCDSMKYIFDIEQYNSLIISKLGICDQSNEV